MFAFTRLMPAAAAAARRGAAGLALSSAIMLASDGNRPVMRNNSIDDAMSQMKTQLKGCRKCAKGKGRGYLWWTKFQTYHGEYRVNRQNFEVDGHTFAAGELYAKWDPATDNLELYADVDGDVREVAIVDKDTMDFVRQGDLHLAEGL